MSGSGSTLLDLPVRPDLTRWKERLARVDGAAMTDASRIDALRELEELKGAVAAAQARITAAFDSSQRESARPSLKQEPRRLSRSISAQIGLARRESASRGQQHLGVALALVRDLPHTHAALTRGEISEWRATLIVRETACLSREDRLAVDTELASSTKGFLTGWGDRKIAQAARAIGYRLDPGAAIRRNAKAEKERRVSVRPAPDTMVNLTGLVPAAHGIAAYAALRREAERLRSAGDQRSLDQLTADLFLNRLTGQADPAAPPVMPRVEVELVMPERTLMRGGHEPAHLVGYGPLPAALARRLVRDADNVWLRRLYTSPESGELVAMDSRARTFTGQLRHLLVLRDQTCRTPWCDAPIRHADHVRAAFTGGRTSGGNGQGLCEACNYAKADPGWRADIVSRPDRRVIELITPTGHRYRSHAPPQPGHLDETA